MKSEITNANVRRPWWNTYIHCDTDQTGPTKKNSCYHSLFLSFNAHIRQLKTTGNGPKGKLRSNHPDRYSLQNRWISGAPPSCMRTGGKRVRFALCTAARPLRPTDLSIKVGNLQRWSRIFRSERKWSFLLILVVCWQPVFSLRVTRTSVLRKTDCKQSMILAKQKALLVVGCVPRLQLLKLLFEDPAGRLHLILLSTKKSRILQLRSSPLKTGAQSRNVELFWPLCKITFTLKLRKPENHT